MKNPDSVPGFAVFKRDASSVGQGQRDDSSLGGYLTDRGVSDEGVRNALFDIRTLCDPSDQVNRYLSVRNINATETASLGTGKREEKLRAGREGITIETAIFMLSRFERMLYVVLLSVTVDVGSPATPVSRTMG